MPQPLYAAANGALEGIIELPNDWRTFRWVTRYPIAPYNVTLNIANYGSHIRRVGQMGFPLVYFYLNETQHSKRHFGDHRSPVEQRMQLLDEATKYLSFFERTFGPYPFGFEKLAIVETNYLGMEHQTIISYGNGFRMENGVDMLLLHELAHEWWGNKVTASDWAHFWIHEGICTYASAMYLEEAYGFDAMLHFLNGLRPIVQNRKRLVPSSPADTRVAYHPDIYNKGALALHALRFLLGKKSLDSVLFKFANNPQGSYKQTVDSQAFFHTVEEVTGQRLDWFFDVYFKRAALPVLEIRQTGNDLVLCWNRQHFTMPVEVAIQMGGELRYVRVSMPKGRGLLKDAGKSWRVDPRGWLLMRPRIISGKSVPDISTTMHLQHLLNETHSDALSLYGDVAGEKRTKRNNED